MYVISDELFDFRQVAVESFFQQIQTKAEHLLFGDLWWHGENLGTGGHVYAHPSRFPATPLFPSLTQKGWARVHSTVNQPLALRSTFASLSAKLDLPFPMTRLEQP